MLEFINEVCQWSAVVLGYYWLSDVAEDVNKSFRYIYTRIRDLERKDAN